MKKIKDKLIEVRKRVLKNTTNSNMVINVFSNNKDDNVINRNPNNKETKKVVTSNNNTNRFKIKRWPKRKCLVTGDSMLEHNDECPEKLMQMFDFFSAKTEDMFCHIVLSLKKARLRNTLLRYK